MAENENKVIKEKLIELPEGVTIEMVNAWKERYGVKKVKLATLSSDDFPTFDIVVRVPDRNTMGEFEKWLDKSPNKAKEILIKACVLSNKDEVLVNDDKFLAAFNAIAEILPIQKAIIKNL
ncbi:MAG: hypothetical protein IMY72_11745 [Bacteroidetes bacterium]|nr:hypothetical protein [Bacteroidota bacterium]